MRTPRGHIRRHGNRYEIAVPVGRDPITKRYRYVYDSASTEEQAERRRAALIEQITQGRVPQARATVSDLIDRWLSVAELELITTVNYHSYIERVIRPVLRHTRNEARMKPGSLHRAGGSRLFCGLTAGASRLCRSPPRCAGWRRASRRG
jgi:hypothetical protein